MGLDPDEDVGTVILDGDFATGIPWTINNPWQFIGNTADYSGIRPGTGTTSQAPIATIAGNEYSIQFEITNAFFIGASGVIIRINGVWDGTKYTTNGVHRNTFIAPSETLSLIFNVDPKFVGSKCNIDNASIIINGDFVGDILGIDWARTRRKEYFIFAGNRRNQILASRFDKTNCLIAFDV